jgi:hypothetical protein
VRVELTDDRASRRPSAYTEHVRDLTPLTFLVSFLWLADTARS